MANPPAPPRNDPIQADYFRPLETAESASSWLFYLGAFASFAPLLIDRTAHPKLYQGALVVFVLAVVLVFITGTAIRLYFFPRAEDARRKEFLSNTFGFDLIHQRTTGYYNNNETDPHKRMGLLVLENLFFTKAILREMAPAVRAKAFIYLFAWLGVLLWQDIPLDCIAAAAQVLFSEEIIIRWLRLEWLRSRSERIYDGIHRLFQSNPAADKLFAYAVDAFGDYESGKTLGGILLPQKIFDRLNPTLTAEWEMVKKGLPALII
jgi:hypothetical protein